MKRLNNKGFTLIELLAVVVILAIVMGIAGTSVLNSINNSRTSSLYSAAQTAANNLNTWVAEDALVTTDNKQKLGSVFIGYFQTKNKDTWVCLNGIKIQNASGNTTMTDLYNVLGFSNTDVAITSLGSTNINANAMTSASTTATSVTTGQSCSAIKYNSTTGSYEILLVANQGGKFYNSTEDTHFAYSSATAANITP